MHKSLFQNPTLLHLTLGTMALLDDREGQLAKDISENCSDLVLRFLNDFFRKSPCTTDKCTLANLIMLFLKKTFQVGPASLWRTEFNSFPLVEGPGRFFNQCIQKKGKTDKNCHFM